MLTRTLLRSVALGAGIVSLTGVQAPAVTFHVGSGSIDGSLCVGNDCIASEAFGFDTVRLKENNLRLHFDDTSNTSNFPANDWRIIANDSANGGSDYLAVEDASAGRFVFRVFAGARSNALVIDSQGDIGIGTTTPATDIDIKIGDTPTVRLQQDGTSGFTPQTWDVAGNEAGFFIRDATNGSTLPFRLLPGAASQAFVIAGDGEIGIGAGVNPDGALHIRRDANAYLTLENSTAGRKWYFTHENAVPNRFIIGRDDAGPESLFLGADGSLKVGGNGDVATGGMVLDSAGNMSIGGLLNQTSDRNAKMAIEPVDTGAILDKVASLPVSSWSYKTDAETGIRHIGPMAQDFHATFGVGVNEVSISSIDTGGVALAAIQALAAENAEQRAVIDDHRDEMAGLLLRIEGLERQLSAARTD